MKVFRRFAAFVFLIVLSLMLNSPICEPMPITALSEPSEAKQYYLSENSNVDTIHATTVGALPCIGEAKILVFYVDFKGGATNWTKSKTEVESMFFSEVGKTDPSVSYTDSDSLRSYFYRSSYGKVDITGTVFEYQTQNHTSQYSNVYMVFDEIIEYYKNTINWDEYDGNNDGYIDGIYIVAKNRHSWGGPNFVSNYSNSAGNKLICKACFIDSCDLGTICHETCHMFGPADMYSGVSVNPSGIQTASIMENGYGDLPGATKFILGWLDNVTFVDINNVGSYNLRSYTNYGDVLVIYPNGDSTNRNWFFVEYVTCEGNNREPGSSGIRIWKTQMDVDENYDITNSKIFCEGMPNSPYQYLEAVHPDDVWNYYMQVGEEISPYTYPSTSYSDTFYNIGGAKYFKDLTFSGISVSVTDIKNEIATVDIRIEERADTSENARATLESFPPDRSSAFLDNKELIHFASLKAEAELKLTSPITLISESSNTVYTLESALTQNNREIKLYITPDMLAALRQQSDWTVSVSNVTTYYGANLDMSNTTGSFDFSKYPTVLLDCNGQYPTNFYMSFEYGLKCFKISDSIILSIYFDDTKDKLYWGEINIETNTTETTELQLPDNILIDEWTNNESISIWNDHSAYFVHIGNYICCYSGKDLISCLNLSGYAGSLTFKGTDGNSFFISSDNQKLYQLDFKNNTIILEHVDIDLLGIPLYMIKHVYCFVENQYIISTSEMVRFIDKEKNTVKEISYGDRDNSFSDAVVYYLDDTYYIFASNIDLVLYRLNADFDLLSESCILRNLSSTIWGPFELNVILNHNSWIIYFESVSYSNAIAYANTYVIICAKNGLVINYYKYGDASFRRVCQFVPISEYKFVCIEAFYFKYVRTECTQHSYGAWTKVLDPTCAAEGLECRSCSSCNYFEARYTAVTEHDYESIVTPPVYPNQGYTTHTCKVCGHTYKDGFNSEFSYIPGDLTEDEIIDTDDALYLMMSIFFPEQYKINQNCDFTGDGLVDTDDAIYLLMAVYFPDTYPLRPSQQ